MSGGDFDEQVVAGDMPETSQSPEKNGLDNDTLVGGDEVGIEGEVAVEGEIGIEGKVGGGGEVEGEVEDEGGVEGEIEDGGGVEGQVEGEGGFASGGNGGIDVGGGGGGGGESEGGHGGKRWPGWPGENVFRMLVPAQKVGGIIGRKGEFIKKLTEETKARIKILDGPPGTTERAVMVSAKEEPDATIPPAMDGLLRVHKRIVDVDNDPANATSGAGGTVITRLLVADTQAGSLIGKHGATIKTIQDSSGCTIRVLGSEHLPLFALQDDSIVEVQGEPAGVHKAVELIATQLRKFLVDRSVIAIFETQMQNPNARANQNMPPPQSWGPPPHPPQGYSMNAGGGPGFGPNSQYMPPPRQHDNYYSPADMTPMEKQSRQGPPAYGRDSSLGIHHSSMPPQQSMVSKVTQHMQIPLAYADAVIGTSGANISYIRRTSGATIAIQETRGVPGEMTVEISGSASQIQTAQQLIQNFIAEAASATQNNPPPGGSMNQGYNSYPSHGGHMYGSPPRNAPPVPDYGHAAGEYGHAPGGDYGHAPAGDYGPVYGNNYGYQ